MRRIYGCLGWALAMSATAWAQTPPPVAVPPVAAPAAVANPYTATVPVAGTSDAQRSAAISAALAQVLQQTAPGFSPGAATLAGAAGYVRTYHYQRAAAGGGLELQVTFDPRAVGRMVARAGSGASGAATAAATRVATAATSGNASPTAASAAAGATPTAAAANAAPAAPSSGTAEVWVGGIGSTHAFASVVALLRGDAALSQVLPVGADGDGVMLQVTFSQPLAGVLAALETPDGHLAAAPTPHAGAEATLQWTP